MTSTRAMRLHDEINVHLLELIRSLAMDYIPLL